MINRLITPRADLSLTDDRLRTYIQFCDMSLLLGRGKLARRSVFVLVDQSLASLGNFLLPVVVIRSGSDHDIASFGAWSLAAAMVLAAVRAAGAESSLYVAESHWTARMSVSLLRRSIALALSASIVFGLIGVMWPASSGIGYPYALALPVMAFTDWYRFSRFRSGDIGHALTMDASWTGLQIVLFITIYWVAGNAPITLWIATWSLCGIVGVGLAIAICGNPIKWPPDTTPSVRSARPVGSWSLMTESVASNGSALAAQLLINIYCGATGGAGFRASMLLASPFLIFLQITPVTISERIRASTADPIRLVAIASSCLGLLATLWFSLLWLIHALPELLVGDRFNDIHPLYALVAAQVVLNAIATPAVVACRITVRRRYCVYLRIAASSLFVLGTLAGGVTHSTYNAMLGMTAATALSAVGWWGLLLVSTSIKQVQGRANGRWGWRAYPRGGAATLESFKTISAIGPTTKADKR